MFQGQHLKYSVLTSPPDLGKSHPIKRKTVIPNAKYLICCLGLLDLSPNASKKKQWGDVEEKIIFKIHGKLMKTFLFSIL